MVLNYVRPGAGREWELGMMNDIKRRGGVLFMNGHPATDAWRHARFSFNMVEDTQAHWGRWTHLYHTPHPLSSYLFWTPLYIHGASAWDIPS